MNYRLLIIAGVSALDHQVPMSVLTIKSFLLAASAATFCLSGCTGPGAQSTHVWKSGSSYSLVISDPLAWSADQFADSPNASIKEAQLESFEVDIDHDCIPELFVTSRHLLGQALGPYLGFRRSGSRFYYIGCLGMNRHSFRVLPLGPDKHPRVLVYWRAGGGETGSGTLATVSNDGRRFNTVHTEEISGEEANRRYEQAFRE